MAKALLGYMGDVPNSGYVAELTRLRSERELVVGFLGNAGLTDEQVAVLTAPGEATLAERTAAIARLGAMPTEQLVLVSVPEDGVFDGLYVPDQPLDGSQTFASASGT